MSMTDKLWDALLYGYKNERQSGRAKQPRWLLNKRRSKI